MKKNILISIIVNCYNCEKYLKEAMQSILNQTYENFEVIFWDNQSTDKSVKIVKSFDDNRIKYYYAPSHTELGKARNLAIQKVSSAWIAFLDTDDIWDKEKLSLSIKKIVSDDLIGLVYNKTIIIDSYGKKISFIKKVYSGNIYFRLLKEGNFIVQSSIIVKKKLLDEIGGIDESLKFCPDYDMTLKITKKYKASGIDKYLTYYRMHSENLSSKKLYENNIEVVKMLNEYIKDKQIDKKIKKEIYTNNSYRIGSLFVKLLLKFEFKNAVIVLYKHSNYLFFFPISVIKKIIRDLY